MDLIGTVIDAIEDLAGRSKYARPVLHVSDQTGLRVHVSTQDGLCLEVENEGARASFTARLQLIAGADKVHALTGPIDFAGYTGVWATQREPVTTLAHGDKDCLVIGRIDQTDEAPLARSFRLAFYDTLYRRYAEYATTGWIEGVASIFPPRLELRVTIASTTAPQRVYANTFVLNVDDPQVLRDERAFTSEYYGIRYWHY